MVTTGEQKIDIKSVKAFLFDLDGTLYVADEVIDGARETLDFLRKNGKRIIFLTNNSSRTDDEYYKRLKRLKLYDDGDIVYSSLDAFVDYIENNDKNAKIYPVAGKKVIKYLKKRVNVVSCNKADTLLTTFDKTITFDKIVNANNLLRSGVKYFATHPDLVCPDLPYSKPDLGSFTLLFKASSGREPDLITGKPFTVMSDCIMKKYGLNKGEVVMTGDRLNTDIAFGVNAGFKTVLVFSGETNAEIYKKSTIKADFAIKSVKEFIRLF